MTVCNSCRYCEGLCAVFPAMEMRRSFSPGDLDYLANLCHSCGACYIDCQFSPPHEFAVNVPATLAALRRESYGRYAWPGFVQPLFARNGLLLTLAVAAGVAGFLLGFVARHGSGALLSAQASFYAMMPHNAMALLFGAAFAWAMLAFYMGLRAFLRGTGYSEGASVEFRDVVTAVRDAATLRYLDGGGSGCHNSEDQKHDRRRLYHQFTFWGFMLCFAATSVATLYHYLLAREAPYPWWDLPVVLGTLGGIGLVVGPVGLAHEKVRRDHILLDEGSRGMDVGFLVMLWLTGATGLALLALRATSAMPVLLAVHLGVVFALFVTMPYGKFVHGIYRFAALVRYAAEHRRIEAGCATGA